MGAPIGAPACAPAELDEAMAAGKFGGSDVELGCGGIGGLDV